MTTESDERTERCLQKKLSEIAMTHKKFRIQLNSIGKGYLPIFQILTAKKLISHKHHKTFHLNQILFLPILLQASKRQHDY